MKHFSLPSPGFIVALFLAAGAGAAEKPESKTELDPVVVTGIRPLVKVAAHPILEPRFGAAVVAEGSYLYIIGGSNSDGIRLDSVERIDLRTGRAESWAKLAVARRHHRAVILGGKIYVLGGTSGGNGPNPLSDELSDYYGEDPTPEFIEASGSDQLTPGRITMSGLPYDYESTVEVIDLATGKVENTPRMPVAKAMFGCAVVDGRILVIGGQKLKGLRVACTNTTEVYDPAARTWSPGINMPTPRRGSVVMVDGFVLFLGGNNGSQPLTTVELFNPREKVWRRLPDLSEPINPSAAVWAGNYLFLFGDQNQRSRQLVYDLRSKQLVPYPLSLPDSDFASAVQHGGKIYVVGGASLRQQVAATGIEVFSPTPEVFAMTGPARK